ncbi:MAG: radical SAM family heme chaperone HemW [Pseudomonadota bacterium]
MTPFGPAYGFGLYVHWPYCARICPYCDFNVYAAKDRDTSSLVDAIVADIQGHRDRMPTHPALQTIFFGGGTPSLLMAADIERILLAADNAFGVSEAAEITLEANPNDVLRADLAGWRTAGVNRLSLGLQSLDEAALSFLGRDHDAASGRKAAMLALAEFPSVSLDLIYARPGQTPETWREELRVALGLGAQHLSLYELTIEERTVFGKRAARGELIPMQDDDQADLYELTQSETAMAGLPAYEVSNHACSADHRARHNIIYWRGGDWIGVGPGAHGRLSPNGARIATEAERRPQDYVEAVATTGRGYADEIALSQAETARELLPMGLRVEGGVEQERLAALGTTVDSDAVARFVDAGLLTNTDGRLALSRAGRLLADRIAADLLLA